MSSRRPVLAVLVAAVAVFTAPALASPAWSQQAAPKAPSASDIAKPSALGDIVIGKEDAPVTIIEYASMTCSHCATFAKETYPKLKSAYIDTGKVRYIFREFPLDRVAMAASVLARCAGKDDKAKTFAMIEAMFAQQEKWAFKDQVPALQNLAKQFGLGEKEFEACFADEKLFKALVDEAKRTSEVLGVNSTPTLFINGTAYPGAASFEELDKILKPLLPN